MTEELVDCRKFGHYYERAKTIGHDARGRPIRKFYCDCGAERPRRNVKEAK